MLRKRARYSVDIFFFFDRIQETEIGKNILSLWEIILGKELGVMELNKRRNNRSLTGQLMLRTVKLFNVIFMSFLFGMTWLMFYEQRMLEPFFARGNYYITFIFFILYLILVRLYDGLAISYARVGELVYSQSLSAFISDFIMYLVIMLLVRDYTVNPLPLLGCFGLQVLFAVIWCLTINHGYFNTFAKKSSIIVYDERKGLTGLIKDHGLDNKFDVQKKCHVNEVLRNLDVLHDYDVVFLAGVHSKSRNKIIKYCVSHNITSLIIPRVGDTLMASAHRMHILHLPVLRLERYNPTPEYLFIKRAFDIVVSLIAIIILSPFMIITALAIKSDGGPALYKQVRLTKDGKEFKVLKFRSMRVDAEKDGVARLSTGENDDRITKVGHVIRAIRFDELPQLFNILKGDMTIVGPRPERPEIAKQYYEELPEFALRLQCKAGLTGYAQVYGKYNTEPYDKLLMDLMYISQPGILQDLHIMFATVKILFMKESTEGVVEGKTTALEK